MNPEFQFPQFKLLQCLFFSFFFIERVLLAFSAELKILNIFVLDETLDLEYFLQQKSL